MKDKDGYGVMRILGKKVRMHRHSYRLHFGEIPSGLSVLHRCDNPSCVNPDHLFGGTAAENAADRHAKGRDATPTGESNARAKLTEADVYAIRSLWAAGGWTKVALAKRFGVSDVAILNAITGRSWGHLEGSSNGN